MLQQEIEFAIDWLDNGGLPWFAAGVILVYGASVYVVSRLPRD